MRQQTLTEFDPSYAELVSEVLPEDGEGVFFKDKHGLKLRGYFFDNDGEPDFECMAGVFPIDSVESWHPVRVDI